MKNNNYKQKVIGLISILGIAIVCVGFAMIAVKKHSPEPPSYLDMLSPDTIIINRDGAWTGTGEDVMPQIMNEIPEEDIESWINDEDFTSDEEKELSNLREESVNLEEEQLETGKEKDTTKEVSNLPETEIVEEIQNQSEIETNKADIEENQNNYEYSEKDYIQGVPDQNFVDPYVGDENGFSGTLDFGNPEEHVSDFSDLYESDLDMSGWEVY